MQINVINTDRTLKLVMALSFPWRLLMLLLFLVFYLKIIPSVIKSAEGTWINLFYSGFTPLILPCLLLIVFTLTSSRCNIFSRSFLVVIALPYFVLVHLLLAALLFLFIFSPATMLQEFIPFIDRIYEWLVYGFDIDDELGIELFSLSTFLIFIATLKYCIAPTYALLLSIIPLSRLKPPVNQAIYASNIKRQLRELYRSRYKALKTEQRSKRAPAVYYLILSLLISWCIICCILMSNISLLYALIHLDLIKFTEIISNLQFLPIPNDSDNVSMLIFLSMLAIWSVSITLVVRYLHFWRRLRQPQIFSNAMQRLCTENILLLRDTDNDNRTMWDAAASTKLLKRPFEGSNYEDVIAQATALLGGLHSLASRKEKRRICSRQIMGLKYLLKRLKCRRLVKLIRRLYMSLPLSPPPADIGWRHFLSNQDWQSFVKSNLANVKGIVVLYGPVNKAGELDSKALIQELDWIKTGGHLQQTVFLFPPKIRSIFNLFSNERKRRWSSFLSYLTNGNSQLVHGINPKHIRCIVINNDIPNIITSTRDDEVAMQLCLVLAAGFIEGESETINDWATQRFGGGK